MGLAGIPILKEVEVVICSVIIIVVYALASYCLFLGWQVLYAEVGIISAYKNLTIADRIGELRYIMRYQGVLIIIWVILSLGVFFFREPTAQFVSETIVKLIS